MPKGKGPVNRSTRPVNTTSEFGQIMERLQRARVTPGAAESRYMTAAQRAQEELEYVKGRGPDPDQTIAEYYGEVADIGSEAERFREQVRQEQIARQQRYNVEYQQRITRFASTRMSATRIRQGMEEERVMRAGGYNVMAQPGFGSMRRRYAAATQRLEQYRENLGILSQDPNTSPELLERAARKVTGTEEEIARTSFAMERMRVERADPASIYATGMKVQQQLRGEAEFRMGYTGEIGKRQAATNLMSAQTGMDKAWEKFRKALEEGADNVDDLSRAYQQAQDSYVSASNVARGAGIDPSRPQARGGWLANILSGGWAGAALRTTGDLTRFFGVQLPMQRMEAQLGYAELANRRSFDFYKAAREDDIAAARRLAGGWAAAARVGQGMRWAEQTALGFDIAGDIAIASGNVAGTWATDPTGTVSAGMRDAANIAKRIALFTTGVPGALAGIQGQVKALQLFDSFNKVGNYNVQEFTDYSIQAGRATIGMGRQRETALQSLWQLQAPMGPIRETWAGASLQDLMNMGLTNQDITGLTAAGVQGMGAQFGFNNTLAAAARAQLGGTMTAQQFVSMTSQLSNIGINATQNLETIIANATAQGLDTSKNIGQMVSGIISISAGQAARGVDIAAGARETMATTMQSLQQLGVAENLRAGAAQNLITAANQAMDPRRYSLNNVIRMGMLRQVFGNRALGVSLGALAGSREKLEQIEAAMVAGDPKKVQQTLYQTGLSGILAERDINGNVTGVNAENLAKFRRFTQRTYALTTPGYWMMSPKARAEYNKYALGQITFNEMSDDVKDEVAGFNAAWGIGLGGFANIGREDAAKEEWVQPGTRATQANRERIRKGKMGFKILKEGASVFEEIDTSGDVAKQITGLNDFLDAIERTTAPRELAEAAPEAAERFETPATKIGEAANVFERAVNKFAEAVGVDVDKDKTPIKSLKQSEYEAIDFYGTHH